MPKLKKYFVYIDYGQHVSREAVPAKSEKDARAYCAGNGEIIAVKDVTEDYPIADVAVWEALEAAGFGSMEINFMARALTEMGIIG